jgi:hypothetical protein
MVEEPELRFNLVHVASALLNQSSGIEEMAYLQLTWVFGVISNSE